MMNKEHSSQKVKKGWFLALIILLFVSLITTLLLFGVFSWSGKIMQEYDLYACVWNNAAINGFPQEKHWIDKLQDECVCLNHNDYEFNETYSSDCWIKAYGKFYAIEVQE